MLLKNNVQLPLFNGNDAMPTGKHHVSYSEINVFLECSYKHKLQYIDKVGSDAGSIHTEYGKTAHDLLETFLRTRQLPTAQDISNAQKTFQERCKALIENHNVKISDTDVVSFSGALVGIVEQVAAFLDETYPGWEPVAAEYNLFESISGQQNRWFKGFIDSVIRIPRKRKKKVSLNVLPQQAPLRFSDLHDEIIEEQKKPMINNVDWEYVVIDWKTTQSGWSADKKRDFNKQLQLVLYKHFFCSIYNLDLSDVKCAFVLIKKQARKSDGSRIELVPVSVGPVTQQKALQALTNTVKQISAGRTIKNRNSCRYCPYYGTKHCT
jgi:hypothetical protein